ncbi:hypothetical protein PFISCL1PPCAC_15808, partial [Pristionchus fissidentatus]
DGVITIHSIYAIIGTILNGTLLYCMFRYTPSSFRMFGVLMKWSLLYISYGPCGLIGSTVCYVCYTIALFVYVVTFYITLVSFLARLHIIKHGSISALRTVLLLIVIATPAPVTFAVSFLVSKSDDAKMRAIMQEKFPGTEYNVTTHMVTGNENIITIAMLNVMIIVTILITPLYIVILIIRSAILRRIHAGRLKMSARTKHMHTQFVRMLTVQAALPLVLILAVFTFCLGQFELVKHPAIESASILIGETPSLISPIVVFCHIPSYQR